MVNIFKEYIIDLGSNIPTAIYIILLLFLIVTIIFVWTLKNIVNKLRYVCGALLAEYGFILYWTTFFCRSTFIKRAFDLKPFWSYQALINGDKHPDILFPQIIMNVVAYVPIGFLLGATFHSMRWWMGLLIGAVVSISIEALQLFYSRGFAEFDDVMHNTLGCMIGYGIYKLGLLMVRKAQKSLYF